jgi:carboxylate-amine ligase
MRASRSLGVEEEFHLVDGETSRLAPRAPQVLGALPGEGFAAELQRSTVETNTAVCRSLDELRQALLQRRQRVIAAAGELGLGVVAAGTAPLQTLVDFELTSTGRFSRMQRDYRLLVNEHLVCSLQVHVGVASRDLAVRLLPRVEAALPVLLALSSSSPYWQGQDSGYASVRTTVWQRWPTAGRAPCVASYADYEQLVRVLIANGTICDEKMTYFDIRPSPRLPTVELRVCDACPIVDDVVLIAALFRAVVEQAAAAEHAGAAPDRIPDALYRAAMWRAARSGLSGSLLDGIADATPVPASSAVLDLIARLRPQLEEAGDWDAVTELASAALARGTSSDRQRARYACRGRLVDVVGLLIEETSGQSSPGGLRPRSTLGYRSSSMDEAVRASGVPVAVYEPIFSALEQLKPLELSRRAGHVQAEAARQGLTFGVGGQQHPFPVDGFPRVISAQEWQVLTAGLIQRARALEAYLRDAYGPARIVRDRVMASDALTCWQGWRPEGRVIPDDVMRAPRWASTWCATSWADGRSWRTMSGFRPASGTQSPCGA